MLKKIVILFVMLTSVALADEANENDKRFSITFHPVGMALYRALTGVFYFWVTTEMGVSDNVSVVAQPVFFTGKYEYASIHGLGVAAGARFFIKSDSRLFKVDGNRQGWYIEPELKYVHGSGSGSVDNCPLWVCETKTEHATANALGAYLLLGFKKQWNSFVLGFDGGLGYYHIWVSGSDEVHAVGNPAEGLAFDTNLYVGFAF